MDKERLAQRITYQLYLSFLMNHQVILKVEEFAGLETIADRIVKFEEEDYKDFPFDTEQVAQMLRDNTWKSTMYYMDKLVEKYFLVKISQTK